MFGKENITLEYTTLHTPQLNVVIERRFADIEEGAIAMLLNAKLNDTDQKVLWEEAVHMCECVCILWQLQAVQRALIKASMVRN